MAIELVEKQDGWSVGIMRCLTFVFDPSLTLRALDLDFLHKEKDREDLCFFQNFFIFLDMFL